MKNVLGFVKYSGTLGRNNTVYWTLLRCVDNKLWVPLEQEMFTLRFAILSGV